MKRWIAGLLALMLLLPSAALAVSYPAQRGAVNDDAGVLSEQTAADIGQLNTAARSADISFVVATRHFLGGADAQAYCDGLFEAWKLDRKTVLVLLVIGEERYAVAVGQGVRDMIGQEQINSLLAAKLRAPYLNDRNYDGGRFSAGADGAGGQEPRRYGKDQRAVWLGAGERVGYPARCERSNECQQLV